MLAKTPFPPGPFSIPDLRFDSRSDRRCDLVLYVKYILELTVVLFCPDLLSAFRLHQLRGDADAQPDPADAALDNVVGAEVVPDPADVIAVPLESKRRIASDNEERAVFGKRRNDVFGDAVRKVLCSGSLLRLSNGRTATHGLPRDSAKGEDAPCASGSAESDSVVS